MSNYTFKVTPDPKGSQNNKPLAAPPLPREEQQNTAEPCPPKTGPCPPKVPDPCPPKIPDPCPPVMPEPLYPPVSPIAPMPPSFGAPPVFPQYPEYFGQPGYPVYSIRLAHSYTPWQYYNVVYGPGEALDKGTMFPELYQPQGVYGPCEGPQPCKAIFPWGGAPYGC